MICNLFNHSFYIFIALVLAIWIPTWFLPSSYGFNSANEGDIETDLNQYNTITFITYPIILDKMSSVRKYNITFSSMLSISKFTNLIIFEANSKIEYHEKLFNLLIDKFGERRVTFISNDLQFDKDSELLLSSFSSKAISQVRTKFVCYINANVVVDPFWYDRITKLFNLFFEIEPNSHIYLTGRRIQIPLSNNEIKEFNMLPSLTKKNFFKSLRKLINSKKDVAECIKQCESDYFLTTVDPAPFDLRYLPEFKLSGGIFSMYLNYMGENKGNFYTLNENVPVYYLGSLPDINDKDYITDSQYNYDIVHNNSYHISKNFEMSNTYNGRTFTHKWEEKEVNESSFSTLLNLKINCSDKSDMPNITLTSFSTINNHYYQNNGDNHIPGFNGMNQNDENENGNNLDQKNIFNVNDSYDPNKIEKNDNEDRSYQKKKNKNEEEKDEDQTKKEKKEVEDKNNSEKKNQANHDQKSNTDNL